MKIPRIIHQTWKEKTLPPHLEELSLRWQALHPGWAYRLWTDADNRELIANSFPDYLDIYDGFEHPIQKADAARYFFLYQYGGVYIDLDYLPLQSIENMLAASEILFALEPPAHCEIHNKPFIVSNAFMATVAEHPFFDAILAELPRPNTHENPNTEILSTTGPFMLTQVYEAYGDQQQVSLADARYFCPLAYEEVEQWLATQDHRAFRRKTQGALAVHLFAGSWWKGPTEAINYSDRLHQAMLAGPGVSKIPRVFHLTWKEEKVPAMAEPLLQALKDLHPDWEIKWWTDESMLEFILRHAPEFADSYVEFPLMIQRCDFFRLLVVFKMGGIYLDLDIVLARSFTELGEDVDCFFPCEKVMSPEALAMRGNRDAVRIGNYAFGSIPGHPFLHSVIESIADNSTQSISSQDDVLETTGPGILSTLYHDYVKEYPDANIDLFYPEADVASRCQCERYAEVAPCQIGRFGRHRHLGSWR